MFPADPLDVYPAAGVAPKRAPVNSSGRLLKPHPKMEWTIVENVSGMAPLRTGQFE